MTNTEIRRLIAQERAAALAEVETNYWRTFHADVNALLFADGFGIGGPGPTLAQERIFMSIVNDPNNFAPSDAFDSCTPPAEPDGADEPTIVTG